MATQQCKNTPKVSALSEVKVHKSYWEILKVKVKVHTKNKKMNMSVICVS